MHIISFDVPYPPSYGGVIDVFYKLKALSELGVDIYLHVFEYGRGKQSELNNYCKEVYYYKRKSYLNSLLTALPFRVVSRKNDQLITRLKEIEAPILFEGLHTCHTLVKEKFNDRKILVRAHNIEHLYFYGLAKSEKNILKKLYFKLEAKRFLKFEQILKKADNILTISPSEQHYFDEKYPSKAIYIPAFHQNKEVISLSGKGEFALYHGDLRVADNIKAAEFLIEVFNDLPHKLIIASSFKNSFILNKISKYQNIEFVTIEEQQTLAKLFTKAHINVLPTFQKTGIKLKLINTLYNSRFCLVNDEMIDETGLENACEIANTQKEFREKVLLLFKKEFTQNDSNLRAELLKPFDTKLNAQKITELL